MSDTHVLLGIPMRGNPAWSATRAAELSAVYAQHELGIAVTLHAVEGHATALARNKIVQLMLDESECTHLWFVDDDTVVQQDALVKLMALQSETDAAIVSGLTPAFIYREHSGGNGRFARRPDNQKCGLGVNVQIEEDLFLPCWPVGCFPIVAAGTSCMLIRREVFQKVEHPWFNYFETRSGKHSSEDIPFCRKARHAGFKLWCDASVICDHIKEVALLSIAPQRPSDEQHAEANAKRGIADLHSESLPDRVGVR